MPRYHSTIYTNPEMRKLLRMAGIDPRNFALQNVKGKPAKTKHTFKIVGNKLTLFGSDFVAKGFIL